MRLLPSPAQPHQLCVTGAKHLGDRRLRELLRFRQDIGQAAALYVSVQELLVFLLSPPDVSVFHQDDSPRHDGKSQKDAEYDLNHEPGIENHADQASMEMSDEIRR